MTKWLSSCLLPRQRETKCRQKEARVRLRQSEVFFPLPDHVIVVNHVVPQGICPGLFLNRQSLLSILSSSCLIKCGGRQQPSMAINFTTIAAIVTPLQDQPFWFYRKLERSQAENIRGSRENRFHDKSLQI